MRILVFAAGGDIGGGKTHILNLAHELSKDNELRLVCFRIGEMSKEAQKMGIDTVAIDVKEGWTKTKALAFNQAREFKPDLIHCHGSKANLLGVLVKNKTGIPVMTTVHSDPELDYMGSPLRNMTYGNLNRWALKHMDYYTAVGGTMHDLLISRGFDPYKIDHVFNAIRFDAITQPKEKHDTITVGIAARLNPVKDISTLINAFAIAYKQDNRLRLSIAGTGEEGEKLKALVSELGLNDVCTFEGWVSDMREYFKRVDINVLSSLSETFPYSLLEGALNHVPAIASKVGGIPYLIQHEETGLLFEAGDAGTFAKEILTLSKDEELRNRLAENLYCKARDEFSIERMRKDQQAIYDRLVSRNSRTGRQGAVLCGAYGKGNAGDDAILRAIIASLREKDADMPIYVMSRTPKDTSIQTHVNSLFTFDVLKLKKILSGAKLFISGGGTLIQDVTSTRSLMFYLYTLKLAKKAGAKVEMYGCGIGPIGKARNRVKTAKVLNESADIITLRDSISLELLSEIGVNKPQIALAADPTVNLPEVSKGTVKAAFERAGIDSQSKKIIFCLRPWDEFKDYSPIVNAAEDAYNKHGLIPVFLPMEYPRDVEIGETIGQKLKVPHFVSTTHHPIEELRGMLASAELVVGMRLHSLIFAAAGGAPIVAISYDVKVDSFVKDSGAKRIIPLKLLTADKLIENIDLAISEGRAMGDETKKKLQNLETINSDMAAKLLGEN